LRVEKTVVNPRHPFRLNVGFLINSSIGTYRDFTFDFETVNLGTDLTLKNFSGTARFDRTPQGLLLQGHFQGDMDLECVRCLDLFSQTLKWSLTDLYAFDKRSVSESNLLVPEDGQIDLEPLLREYSMLEIPIKPVCKPDCKGLCPVCRENLNRVDCGHHPEDPSSPFSALRDKFK
jgi:uncharacterized protein